MDVDNLPSEGKLMKYILLLAFALFQFSCATIMKSEGQMVEFFGGDPQGTQVTVQNMTYNLQNGGGEFYVRRAKQNIPIQVTCAGQTNDSAIVTSYDALAGVFGNLVFGGIIGMAIDAGSDKTYNPPQRYDVSPLCASSPKQTAITVQETPKLERKPAGERFPVRADFY